MVAGFLMLQLYRVLGKRTGHEQILPKPAEERAAAAAVTRPLDTVAEAREPSVRVIDDGAETGLRAISAADSSFDLAQFLNGAKSAYRMILEAFWKADEEQLGWLVDEEVRQSFADAIVARTEAGHVLDNRLVAIERATIVRASLAGKLARITVRFDADIAAVTRDASGNLVAGSLTDAVQTHDVWTFARTLRSADPNWKLVETDEA
jgi:predicted lipid-binding transport protein (Tim44 family)